MKKNDSLNRRSLIRSYYVLCMLIIFTVPHPLSANQYSFRYCNYKTDPKEQENTYLIRGQVTDIKNIPLPGVTVRYGNTGIGTATDNNGDFTLRLPASKGMLSFSFIGYKSITTNYTADTILIIKMYENIEALEEVTVVAYGTQRRDEVSGSVATIKAEKLQNKPTSNVLNLVKGQMSGVYVSSQSGDPGGNDVSMIIRGASDLALSGNRNPLFVIDGVIASDDANMKIGSNPLTSLNPNDIETFTVLKDAASANIYGSRAANGVVIITTKQGCYNQKTQFSANVSYTYVQKPRLMDRIGGNAERRARLEAMTNYADVYFDPETGTFKYADSYEMGKAYNYFWNEGNGASMPIYQDSLNPFNNNANDLMDYYFNYARAVNANIQARGGSQNITYSVGLGFYDETGTLRNTGNKRFNAFSNLGFKAGKHLSGNFRFYLSYINNSRSGKGLDMFNGSQYNYSTIPDFLLTYSTVLPGPGNEAFEEVNKRYEKTNEKNDSYKLRSSFDLTYEIIEGLKLKSSLAVDYLQNNLNVFLPNELSEYNETYSSGSISRHLMLLNENFLTYTNTFAGDHKVDFLLGFSAQQDEMNNLGGYARGTSNSIHYAPPTNTYISADGRNMKDYTSGFEKKTMVGIFGRLNYNYKQRYFAGFTLRRDGSSTFGKNVRWAWFPAYFLAWDLAQENFMNWSDSLLDNAKVRFSYGKTGRIFEYPYLASGELVQGNSYMGRPSIIPEWISGVTNKNLTWEKTEEYDVGIDLNLLHNRIGVTFDYYLKKTSGMLYNPVAPGTHTGFLRPWKNMFGIDNEGVEIEVKTDLIRSDKLHWNLSFNISKNWNRLAKSQDRRDFQNPDSRFADNISVIGLPLYGIYAYRDRGIYNDQEQVPYYWDNRIKRYLSGNGNSFYRPGDRILIDIDGNGKIYSYQSISEDRVYIGSPLPQFQGGISTNLTWKGFDLNMMFNFVCRKWVLNAAKGASLETSFTFDPDDMARPYFVESLDGIFWKKPGDKTDYPANRLNVGLLNFATNLESNAQRISYLKLQAITVGYTLPESIKSKLGIGARVFFSAENLFTLTDYNGTDPETVDLYTGIDRYNAYPISRRFTLGLTLDF